MGKHLKLLIGLMAVSVLFVASCGDDDVNDAGSSTTSTAAASATSPPKLEGSITVSAATSLKAAFTEIGDGFEKANPGVDVTFNFDASSALATQILEGAPADVFASADETNMAKLTAAKLVSGEPEVFARNELVIVTKPGNPESIATLADLADAGVISLCGAEVPCGKYAKEALDKAGVTIDESKVTRGQNVGATLTAVAQGDAVAGVVYTTDATSAGDTVEAVKIPAEANVIATYPAGTLASSGNATVAKAFVAYVLGADGQAVLSKLGFLPPR